MDIRIRRIFGPFARVIALLLDKMNITLKLPLSISILTTFLGTLSFYLLYGNPWSQGLSLIGILFVFTSGFIDEITRQLAEIKQKKLSELEKVGLGLDRYMDIPIILAALYYLRNSEYDLGFLNFGLQFGEHLIMGAALLLGVYLIGYTNRQRASPPGLETRAERTFYLSAFMTAGYTHDQFPLYLLVGISSLGVILYLASIYAAFKGYTKEQHIGYAIWRLSRPIKYLFLEIFDGIKTLVSLVFRLMVRIRQASSPAELEQELPPEKTEYVAQQGHNFTALVTDGNSSQPIVNAKVALKNKETGKALKNTTNQAGKSDFSGIVEGQYVVTVESNGYKTAEFERFLSMDSGEVFVLSRHSLDLSIVVTDADTRRPIGGSKVTLKSEGKELKSKTDNLGVAYFKELKLGSYDVNVEASNYHPLVDNIDVTKENLKAVELKRMTSAKGASEPIHEIRSEDAAVITEQEERVSAENTLAKAAREEKDERPQIAQVLGESALIKYDSKSKVEKSVMRIVDECARNKRQAFIISAQPRTRIYRDKLRQPINSGMVRVVDLVSDDATVEANAVRTSNLRSFDDVFKEMPAGSVLIIDALSSLIIKEGGVVAYKFVSDAIQYFSAEGLCLVCLLDRDAHEENEIASFEKLFVNLVSLDGAKFVLVD